MEEEQPTLDELSDPSRADKGDAAAEYTTVADTRRGSERGAAKRGEMNYAEDGYEEMQSAYTRK